MVWSRDVPGHCHWTHDCTGAGDTGGRWGCGLHQEPRKITETILLVSISLALHLLLALYMCYSLFVVQCTYIAHHDPVCVLLCYIISQELSEICYDNHLAAKVFIIGKI